MAYDKQFFRLIRMCVLPHMAIVISKAPKLFEFHHYHGDRLNELCRIPPVAGALIFLNCLLLYLFIHLCMRIYNFSI